MSHSFGNKIKLVLTLISGVLLVFSSSQITAQNQYGCGTDANWEYLVKQDPQVQQNWDLINKKAQAWLDEYGDEFINNRDIDPLLIVPVVFHVVYAISGQNVPYNFLNATVGRLNKDFRKLNSDSTLVRAIFKPFAADSRVEFCLATKDPSGNTTSGVTRTSTSHNAFITNNDVKFNITGGKDGWPSNQYLNIWVCDLSPGLGGYGQFPGGPANTDGIVVDFATVGPNGRTTTHEVGHWLGLFHIFQDNCSGAQASNCALAGDKVCDTPQQNGAGFACPTSANTCTETPTDYPDMLENFMSYNSCQYMFSTGQAARMASMINIFRNNLKTSQGCCLATASSITSYPHSEDIENAVFPPSGWIILNPDANVSWSRTNLAGGFGGSSNCAKMYNFSPGQDITGESDYLITPKLDFSGLSAPITLDFNHAYAQFSSTKFDSLIIRISLNQCDDIGTEIWSKGGPGLVTAPDQITEFIPTAGEWANNAINLNIYAGLKDFYLVFEGKSGWGNNLYLDDINILLNVVGDEEIEPGEQVLIYPNPSNGRITISFNQYHLDKNLSLKIVNLLGQEVYRQDIEHLTGNKIEINLGDQVGNGIYFIEIFDQTNNYVIKKKILISDQ